MDSTKNLLMGLRKNCVLFHLQESHGLLNTLDLAVGSHGLISGRVSITAKAVFQHNANKWVPILLDHNCVIASPTAASSAPALLVFLSKDCKLV